MLQNLLTPAQAAFGELVKRRVDGQVGRRLMDAAVTTAPLDALEAQDTLDKLDEARRGLLESTTTPGSAVAGMIALVARYTQLAGSVVLVGIVLGPLWACVICISALIARFGQRGSLSRWSSVWERWAWGARRKLRYLYDTGAEPSFAKDARAFNALPWWKARAGTDSGEFYKRLWKERRDIYFGPFLIFTALVLAGTTATLIALQAAATAHGLGILYFVLAVQAILVPLRFGMFFPEADVQTQYGMLAWAAMCELERRFRPQTTPVPPNERANLARVSLTPLPGAGCSAKESAEGMPRLGARFERVSFAYPGTSRLVLCDLDLELPAGTSTAIVGLNGAGKTTLVKLLAGLYQPSSGMVTVDGINVARLETRAWQRRLAVIFQDFCRYEMDVRANIALGAPWAGPPSDDAVMLAAGRAGATDVISQLPAGLSTPLSSRYSGGTDLSGGQWQRIALARAMYAVGAGASVLVLDEPTAQLDVRAEVAFFDNFLEMTKGLTILVISHRFSTVRRAERIVVLEHGRVSEQGPHEELLALGGCYAQLFQLQAQRFAAGEPDPEQEDLAGTKQGAVE